MTQHMEQRVLVLFDVQNLYYSAKHLYNKKVDFKNILNSGVAKRKLVRAIAYVIKTDIKEESVFHDALENIGIEVKAKDIQIFYGGDKKGDWDIGIAMDAVRMAPKVDTVVLVSGDGDFRELVLYLQGHGVRVEAMAFNETASSRLKSVVDAFTDLSSDKKSYLLGFASKPGNRPMNKQRQPSNGQAKQTYGPPKLTPVNTSDAKTPDKNPSNAPAAKPSPKQSSKKSANKPSSKSTNKTATKTTNKTANKSSSKPANMPSSKPASKQTDRPNNRMTNRSARSSRPAEKVFVPPKFKSTAPIEIDSSEGDAYYIDD
ncbi:NYN domain-containing protein [Candidatus Woesearchaeota archaeon]|nr:NYN domain-containing protein [Candidatus Woesearchaeota archaeon]